MPLIIGKSIIGNTVLKKIRDVLSKDGYKATNKPIEVEKEKPDSNLIPPLSGILSYSPNVYSEEVLMLQKRLNEIYAGVSGYEKLKEDGYFGSKTLEAVNMYKEEHGLWNFGEY
jgi:peptidoglycan hydrolase-like protein with peptidoglycan-binding domain